MADQSEYMGSDDSDSDGSTHSDGSDYPSSECPKDPDPDEFGFRQRKSTESSSTAFSDDERHRNKSVSSDVYFSPPPVLSDSELQQPDESDHSDHNSSRKYSNIGRSLSESSTENPCTSKLNFYNNSYDNENQSDSDETSGLSGLNGNKRSHSDSEDSEDYDNHNESGNKLKQSFEYKFNMSKRPRLESDDSDLSSAPSRKLSSQSEGSELSFHTSASNQKEPKIYSTVAERLMKSMGYKEGKGLGKHGQGIVEPIKAYQQQGKRGLGLKHPNLNVETYRWDASEEVIEIIEPLDWLIGGALPTLLRNEITDWIVIGKKKLSIDNETQFCDSKLLKNILQCKTVFDEMEGQKFFIARNRSNPFEWIKNGPFLNRAAMKMANMDKRLDFMFTNPVNEFGQEMVNSKELLYFADVCAGPGGFSEYVLYRKKWRAKGIGFTLKGDCDFKLEDFFSGPSETFEPYYGVNDNGDVYDPKNIMSLYNMVMKTTDGQGVHFMMADGGFSVEGKENIQEILSKRLYLCQFLVSLYIVRPSGHFVCKVFDMFTPFSAGLLYLMYRAYKQVSIFKPNTSRPANSERYIVCKWKREYSDDIRDFMMAINKTLDKFGETSDKDVCSCVPLEVMVNDKQFFEYLVKSNNSLGERQIVNLAKVKAFYEDQTLKEERLGEIKRDCYKEWNIPLNARVSRMEKPEDMFSSMYDNQISWTNNLMPKTNQFLKSIDDLKEKIQFVYDWYYVVTGSKYDKDTTPVSTQSLFLGTGKYHVFRYNVQTRRWIPEKSVSIQLSPGTLVYAEIVDEFRGEGASQLKVKGFHIIDAYRLGDENISNLHYPKRWERCELYVKSLHQSSNNRLNRVRMKQIFGLDQIQHTLSRVQVMRMKNGMTKLGIDLGDGHFFEAKGFIFLKATKEGWVRSWSRTNRRKYFTHKQTGQSRFDIVPEACATFNDCLHGLNYKVIWEWDYGCGMRKEEKGEAKILSKNELLEYVDRKLVR